MGSNNGIVAADAGPLILRAAPLLVRRKELLPARSCSRCSCRRGVLHRYRDIESVRLRDRVGPGAHTLDEVLLVRRGRARLFWFTRDRDSAEQIRAHDRRLCRHRRARIVQPQALVTSPQRPSAGLPLSVGSAPAAVRVLLAAIFAIVAAACLAGGVLVARRGPAMATIVTIAAIMPLGHVALLAAAFVVAPFSRYGVWLDTFAGALNGRRALGVLVALWLVSLAIVLLLR